MKAEQSELRIKNHAIIRRMMDEGASVAEIMEATGYASSTVLDVMRQIRLETVEKENLTLAEHPKPDMPIVEIGNRKYRDVTEVFLSSEWEESESRLGILSF